MRHTIDRNTNVYSKNGAFDPFALSNPED